MKSLDELLDLYKLAANAEAPLRFQLFRDLDEKVTGFAQNIIYRNPRAVADEHRHAYMMLHHNIVGAMTSIEFWWKKEQSGLPYVSPSIKPPKTYSVDECGAIWRRMDKEIVDNVDSILNIFTKLVEVSLTTAPDKELNYIGSFGLGKTQL